MDLIVFPLPAKLCHRKVILGCHPFIPQQSHFHGLPIYKDPPKLLHNFIPSYHLPRLLHKPWMLRRKEGSLLKTLSTTNSSSSGSEEDHQALEAVLKLYEAIKKKNLQQLSDILGDICHRVCNFIPFFQAFQEKKQVLEFFSHLIKTLGNSIEFVVQPISHNGMSVGVAWKLEWNKNTLPLGKGFSFHIRQIYQGKVLISNVKMFMESFPQLELFKPRMLGFLTCMSEKMSSYISSKRESKRAEAIILLALLCLASIFVLLRKI